MHTYLKYCMGNTWTAQTNIVKSKHMWLQNCRWVTLLTYRINLKATVTCFKYIIWIWDNFVGDILDKHFIHPQNSLIWNNNEMMIQGIFFRHVFIHRDKEVIRAFIRYIIVVCVLIREIYPSYLFSNHFYWN